MKDPDTHCFATRPTKRALPKAGGQSPWPRRSFPVVIVALLIAVGQPAVWAAPKKAVVNQPAAQPFVKPLTAQEREALLGRVGRHGRALHALRPLQL